MSYSKSIAIVLTTAVCTTAFAVDAGAQSRGRSSGGRGPTVGRAVPRGEGPRTQGPRGDGRRYDPRVISPRVIVRAPLRSYYYPYYAYRPGISLGFYGRYGYPYGYGYRYPYGAYGYSYGGYYPAGYGYGGYGRYADEGYGGVRIQGAARNVQVFADGYYAGTVDDFDGVFQRLELEAGPHEIELRAPGFPPVKYNVNVPPGRTVTIHAEIR